MGLALRDMPTMQRCGIRVAAVGGFHSAMPYLLSSLGCVGTSQTRPWEYSSQVSAICCFVADLLGDGIVSTPELGSAMRSRPQKSIGSVQSGIPKASSAWRICS